MTDRLFKRPISSVHSIDILVSSGDTLMKLCHFWNSGQKITN